MSEFVRLLFDTSDFTPRAGCGRWTDGLIALHVAADVLIWLAYLAIPAALVGIAVRRAIPLQRVFVLIAAFVVFCGFTHLVDALMFTAPVYRAAGLLKAATAVVSWGVLAALIPLLPRALTALDLAARQDLLDRLRLLEAAVEQTDDAVVVTAPGPGGPADQRVVYANRAVERQTGFDRAAVADRPPHVLLGSHPEPPDRAAIRDGLADGKPFRAELRGRRADGTPYWADLSLAPVGAGPTRWVGIQRDVTDRRKLEGQLRQSQKLEAVGRLAGGVAHDFNNILTVVRGAADLLRDAPPGSDRARGLADEVGKAADRAAGLVRQLLAFSRAGPTRPEPLDLAAVVEDLTGMLRRLIGDAVALTVDRPAAPVPVVADRAEVEQVVVNLVVNARDALPTGGRVTVGVSEAADPDGRRWARLGVADTGVGMDSATAARAFEPFFTTKGPGRGTGLGLATVYGIITRAGGRVVVDTAPGAGTRVRVDLPWAATSVPTSPPPVPTSDTLGAAGGTVLLVEDEDVVRSLARMALEAAGYDVAEAADGAEAIARLDAGFVPDVVVTDLTMPGADGREVAVRAKAMVERIGVVIVSGYAPDADRLREETGAIVLLKPYSPADLIRAVREVGSERMGNALPAARPEASLRG